MSSDISVVLAVLSLLVSIVVASKNNKRADRTEEEKETARMTTVIVKLENIGNGINEIKNEMKSMKDEIQKDHDLLIKVEASVEQAHKRLDDIQVRGHLPTE